MQYRNTFSENGEILMLTEQEVGLICWLCLSDRGSYSYSCIPMGGDMTPTFFHPNISWLNLLIFCIFLWDLVLIYLRS